MGSDLQSDPRESIGTRASLAAEVRELEEALQRAQERLEALGGEVLPGIFLLVQAGGRKGLVPGSRVAEIARMVATKPLPGAPPHVLGTFVCRGRPVLAVDLAAALGGARSAGIESHIVILRGSPAAGLVVDKVERMLEDPRLYAGDAAAGTPAGWRGSPLVCGLCIEEGEVLPLVDPAPLEALAERTT